jgi:hypothetical protein
VADACAISDLCAYHAGLFLPAQRLARLDPPGGAPSFKCRASISMPHLWEVVKGFFGTYFRFAKKQDNREVTPTGPCGLSEVLAAGAGPFE